MALAATFCVAGAAGAYAHWLLWHPMDGLAIFLTAGALLVAALIVATVRRAKVRPLALFPLVAGIGLLAGQWVGPSRPELQHSDGALSLTLVRPSAAKGDGLGSCMTAGNGSELQVEGTFRLAVGVDDPSIPANIDQREHVMIHVSVGDRWRDDGIHRSDNVDFSVIVGTVVADEPELRLAADDASTIEVEWTDDGGQLRFDRLVVDRSEGDAPSAPPDLAGTLVWTCGQRPLPEGAMELAEAACIASSYPRCLNDLLAEMRHAPGSLVALCDYGEGQGAIVPLERQEDADAWCAAGGPNAPIRVEVLRLPG